MVEIKNVRIHELLSLLTKMSRDGVKVVDMVIDIEERSVMLLAVDDDEDLPPITKIEEEDLGDII